MIRRSEMACTTNRSGNSDDGDSVNMADIHHLDTQKLAAQVRLTSQGLRSPARRGTVDNLPVLAYDPPFETGNVHDFHRVVIQRHGHDFAVLEQVAEEELRERHEGGERIAGRGRLRKEVIVKSSSKVVYCREVVQQAKEERLSSRVEMCQLSSG